jgi:hypothetical protein
MGQIPETRVVVDTVLKPACGRAARQEDELPARHKTDRLPVCARIAALDSQHNAHSRLPTVPRENDPHIGFAPPLTEGHGS